MSAPMCLRWPKFNCKRRHPAHLTSKCCSTNSTEFQTNFNSRSSIGPTFLANEFRLPKQLPNKPQPTSIQRSLKFLKSISQAQRNMLLTGDTVFAFNPIAYEAILFKNIVEPELQRQFDYLLPQQLQPLPGTLAQLPPASPPPGQPPVQPDLPCKHTPCIDNAAPVPPGAAGTAGSSPMFNIHSLMIILGSVSPYPHTAQILCKNGTH